LRRWTATASSRIPHASSLISHLSHPSSRKKEEKKKKKEKRERQKKLNPATEPQIASLDCNCICFSRDGRAILSGWSDGTTPYNALL